jgi:transcriptional accessory protein Tex/SPT6
MSSQSEVFRGYHEVNFADQGNATSQIAEDGTFVNPSDAQEFSRIAITYVSDEVARKYQHSNRVADEFAHFLQSSSTALVSLATCKTR